MNDEQLARFVEMLRLEKIDVASVVWKPNDFNSSWPYLIFAFRAFPSREFYDDDEREFLKEVELVKD